MRRSTWGSIHPCIGLGPEKMVRTDVLSAQSPNLSTFLRRLISPALFHTTLSTPPSEAVVGTATAQPERAMAPPTAAKTLRHIPGAMMPLSLALTTFIE